jgi:hypothetical protein
VRKASNLADRPRGSAGISHLEESPVNVVKPPRDQAAESGIKARRENA